MYVDHSQRGIPLIELIVFIVIVSVGLAGILSVLNLTTSHSADPMIRKQMLVIAEGLMDEVATQPFTWCDPDDPVAATYGYAPIPLARDRQHHAYQCHLGWRRTMRGMEQRAGR